MVSTSKHISELHILENIDIVLWRCQESRSQMGFQPANALVLCKVKGSLLEELGGIYLNDKYVLEITVFGRLN